MRSESSFEKLRVLTNAKTTTLHAEAPEPSLGEGGVGEGSAPLQFRRESES